MSLTREAEGRYTESINLLSVFFYDLIIKQCLHEPAVVEVDHFFHAGFEGGEGFEF